MAIGLRSQTIRVRTEKLGEQIERMRESSSSSIVFTVRGRENPIFFGKVDSGGEVTVILARIKGDTSLVTHKVVRGIGRIMEDPHSYLYKLLRESRDSADVRTH